MKSFEWLGISGMGGIRFCFLDLQLLGPTSKSELELIRSDLPKKPSPFNWCPSDVPLTENFHRPPTSLLLSKQVGSSPSSRQHRMEAKPLTPAPMMATLFRMVSCRKAWREVLECLKFLSRNDQQRFKDSHLHRRKQRDTLTVYAHYFLTTFTVIRF